MAGYIEREALIDAVESIDWYSVYKGKLTAGAPNTENALYKASSIYAVIDNAPSADVAPVRHGRWIWNEEGEIDWEQFYRCSNCGNKEYWESNFCPKCGAKMDLEERQ